MKCTRKGYLFVVQELSGAYFLSVRFDIEVSLGVVLFLFVGKRFDVV